MLRVGEGRKERLGVRIRAVTRGRKSRGRIVRELVMGVKQESIHFRLESVFCDFGFCDRGLVSSRVGRLFICCKEKWESNETSLETLASYEHF